MAYTMTHILAAEKVLKYFPEVRDSSTYILGAIAPDAVHADPNYTVELKEKSHLFTPELRWGEINDWEKAGLWLDNIKKYYLDNKNIYNIDFLLGYIVHLITDVYSSMYFYTPFVESIKDDYERRIEQFKKESYGVNIYLFSLYSEKKDLRKMLHAGEAITLESVVRKEDIEKRIEQLFEFEFQGWDISHIEKNSICRIEDMEQLIQGAAQYINTVLRYAP